AADRDRPDAGRLLRRPATEVDAVRGFELEARYAARADPASLRHVALLREDPEALRVQAPGVARGRAADDHAEAAPRAADRRLPAHPRPPDRRRRLLRHATDRSRARAAPSRPDDLPRRERGHVSRLEPVGRSAALHA